MRSIWKWVGLAGAVGVAAGGVLVVRDQRRRNAYTPDEIRARLHQRLAEADPVTPDTAKMPQPGMVDRLRRRCSRRRR